MKAAHFNRFEKLEAQTGRVNGGVAVLSKVEYEEFEITGLLPKRYGPGGYLVVPEPLTIEEFEKECEEYHRGKSWLKS